MRVFVTGATGFVGSAVVRELLDHGHPVLGLVRSDAGAKALATTGAAVHRGDVQDRDSLQSGAAACDAVIHTAFIHDFSKFKESCEIDRRAIIAMGEALAGSSKPLIVTSGTGLLPAGRRSTEDDAPGGSLPRVATEEAASEVRVRGVNVSVMRLPPSVHGDGDHGFVPMLIGMAREKGVSAYIGAGNNHWGAVHRLDAARLYRLALERRSGPARYHATAEEGVPFKEIAAVIGRRLGLPVVSKSPEEAPAHFTWFAHFAAMDNLASSAKTRAITGWAPTGPGLIADIDRDAYFR
ncbi:SDR family oxidoreductase [Dongia sp.]|uniref:SDR family oxidoreductase n=1 Tax=Dongia sp. TaxID=1977262 RepID=UPI0037532874